MFKKKSLLFKLSLSIGLTLIIAVLYFILFIKLWNSPNVQRDELKLDMESLEDNYKKIIIRNKTNQRINLEVDFEYSDEEIKTQKLNIFDYYNAKSILVIQSNKQNTIMLPINKNQQINFPNNFKIVVKDSLYNNMIKYDINSFFEKSITEPKSSNQKIDAELWILDIR